MLGILGVVSLVLGGFTAGAGAFDWEFLFSDGYREYGWVRSIGREGARGMLMLLGGILMLGGFVSQVVDAASPSALASAALPRQTAENDDQGTTADGLSPTNDDVPAPRPKTDFNSRRSAPDTLAPPKVGKNVAAPEPSAPTTSRPPPPADSTLQEITIWEPDVVAEDGQTLLFLQYRFEAGHRPTAGIKYYWVIDFLGATHALEYEPESLQKQGQLTQVFSAPIEGGGFDQPWSTRLEAEANGRRTTISNRLEISAEGVRNVPLSSPQ
ncbi:MAG TPA: hypothetical protein VFI31_14750 [Pirellulales bacterium]|nr:hypothetical protein [Pirellulales bacterium]